MPQGDPVNNKSAKPTMADFRQELQILIEEARSAGEKEATVVSGELYRRVNRKLGHTSLPNVPMACNAMHQRKDGKRLPGGPPSGFGTRLAMVYPTGLTEQGDNLNQPQVGPAINPSSATSMTTDAEALNRLREKLRRFRDWLSAVDAVALKTTGDFWPVLAEMKSRLGNMDNERSMVATIMAKQYLSQKYDLREWQATTKAQGAPGLDIDILTVDGRRIIGEVKTTVPHLETDLGAQQKHAFGKDIEKLTKGTAAEKYFFVTEERVFDLMKREKYANKLPGIMLVLIAPERSAEHRFSI